MTAPCHVVLSAWLTIHLIQYLGESEMTSESLIYKQQGKLLLIKTRHFINKHVLWRLLKFDHNFLDASMRFIYISLQL